MPPEFSTPGVYIEEIPSGVRPITAAPTAVAAFIGSAYRGAFTMPVEITSMKSYERGFGRGTPLHTALHLFFANGGQEALVVRSRDPGLKSFIQSLHSLDDSHYNLLCLPPGTDPDQVSFAVKACEDQRAILLLDSPDTWTDPQAATAGLSALAVQSANAAIYFPGLAGRGGGEIGPAAAVAGIIARTDAARGVWKAPAGVEATLLGVSGLALQLSDPESDALNTASINPLREFPNTGPVVWGARTLAGNDNEWRYLPVRRTGLFIEDSITNSTGWVVFEPNDAPLWAQLRASVEVFMSALYKQGAFAGTMAKDAYFVRCDQTTTTPFDIAAKRVNLLVGFAPLKPAEFIILKFELQTA